MVGEWSIEIYICTYPSYLEIDMWYVCTVRLDERYNEITFKAYVNGFDESHKFLYKFGVLIVAVRVNCRSVCSAHLRSLQGFIDESRCPSVRSAVCHLIHGDAFISDSPLQQSAASEQYERVYIVKLPASYAKGLLSRIRPPIL
jgi:hypothetical protein